MNGEAGVSVAGLEWVAGGLTIATSNLGVPLVVAAAVGSGIAVLLGRLTLTVRRTGGISHDVLGAGFAAVSIMAVLLTVTGGLVATRSVRRWRPVAD